jgi:hypothetical protein
MPKNRKPMKWIGILWIVIVVWLLAALPSFAQLPTGTILGTVKDPSGGVVPGATVTITNTDTSLTRAGTTGADGSYRFPALPVGHYRVQVTKEGFGALTRTGITLEVAQEAAIDVTLQVGSTGQSVVVTGEAPLVQTTTSTIGGLVNEQQVADLPLNGRNLVDLTLLQAGVVQTTVISATTIGSGLMTGVTLSNNGMPVHSNTYMLDGAYMKAPWGINNSSIIGTTMGVDGVKEYKVVSNLPDAAYGLSMGAQTAIVSKGGGNSFHGDAYDYLRNGSLDARNYFDALDTLNFNGFGTDKSVDFPGKRIPPFHRNNFGGAFGGPIRKDKTFFYAVYEGLRQTWGQTIATNTMPGNCFDQTVGSSTFHQITATSLSTCSGVAAANINSSVLHVLQAPIIPGQVGLFPYPNTNINPATGIRTGSTFNYSFPYIQPTSEDYGQIRLDENFSASDTLFARYTHDDANQIANRNYSYNRDFEFSGMQLATLSETHIFSPTVLNTFRLSFSRNLTFADSTTSPAITDPGVILQPGQDMGGFTPASSVTGLGFIAADGKYINNVYTLSDDVYWTKGKHAFRFGSLLNDFKIPEDGHFNNRGTVSFTNFANLAQGIYSSMTALGGTLSPSQNRYWGYHTFGFYAQDDYRFTPRLTLNLGFRYEFQTIPKELNGNNWQIQNLATADGGNSTQGAVPSRVWGNNPSLHAFSPRIGFAWDPFGNGKTAIRGGAGIYYDIGSDGALLFQLACCQPPLDFFNTINNPFMSIAAMNAANLPPFQIPLPIAYGSAPRTSSNPNGVLSTFLGLASPRNVAYNWHQPTDYQWNLTVDRQLPGDQSITVGYVGARGVHIVRLEEGNPTTILGFLPNGLPYYCHPADNPTGPPTLADQCPTNSVFPPKSNSKYGIVNQNAADSETWYDALQVNWTKRFSHGLSGGIAYTWAKMLDFGSGEQGTEAAIGVGGYFPQVRSIDKAVGGFDIASNLRANVIYHIPDFAKSQGWTANALNGWWMSSIVSVQDGYPLNVLIGNRSLSNNPNAAGAASDRPNLDPSFNPATVITHNPLGWFNTSMFDLPIAGTLGTAARNLLRGPALKNWDFALNKDTKAHFLGEQGNVQFRVEFFNLLNHPNFSNPNATIASLGVPAQIQCGPQFGLVNTPSTKTAPSCQFGSSSVLAVNSTAGQITSTITRSRQIQLSLKVIF